MFFIVHYSDDLGMIYLKSFLWKLYDHVKVFKSTINSFISDLLKPFNEKMWVGIYEKRIERRFSNIYLFCFYIWEFVYTIINSHTSMDKVNCRVVLSAVSNYTYIVDCGFICEVYCTATLNYIWKKKKRNIFFCQNSTSTTHILHIVQL